MREGDRGSGFGGRGPGFVDRRLYLFNPLIYINFNKIVVLRFPRPPESRPLTPLLNPILTPSPYIFPHVRFSSYLATAFCAFSPGAWRVFDA